jgi:hypothetical protein
MRCKELRWCFAWPNYSKSSLAARRCCESRADVMDGVTMEECGISKPVGMRLTADDGQGNKTEAKSAAQKAALRLDA